MGGCAVVLLCSSCLSILVLSYADDIITTNQTLRNGETIVSVGERFELDFFSTGSCKNQYLGTWYKQTYRDKIWVANRDIPLIDAFGMLNITKQGSFPDVKYHQTRHSYTSQQDWR